MKEGGRRELPPRTQPLPQRQAGWMGGDGSPTCPAPSKGLSGLEAGSSAEVAEPNSLVPLACRSHLTLGLAPAKVLGRQAASLDKDADSLVLACLHSLCSRAWGQPRAGVGVARRGGTTQGP